MAKTQMQTGAWIDTPGPDRTFMIRNDLAIPKPRQGEVLIKLEVTGFCHSDEHSIRGKTPMTANIAGHEGVGHVVEVGPGVGWQFIGRRVGVSWLWGACHECGICKVNDLYCPNQINSGRNTDGTFRQYTTAPAKFVTEIPSGISSSEAAPLLCGGLTVIGALDNTNLQPGETVVIPGAGGGLGHLAVQVAKAKGFNVISIDHPSKGELCKRLGSDVFIPFTEDGIPERVRALTGGLGAHAVVVIAGSPSAYRQATEVVRNCGTIVCVGIPPLDFHFPLSPFFIIIRGLRIVGSSQGNQKQMKELFNMVLEGKVKPIIEEHEFGEINNVLQRFADYQISGRVVLRIPETVDA
jgi:propanol-preferring alcohol dehydrogenase